MYSRRSDRRWCTELQLADLTFSERNANCHWSNLFEVDDFHRRPLPPPYAMKYTPGEIWFLHLSQKGILDNSGWRAIIASWELIPSLRWITTQKKMDRWIVSTAPSRTSTIYISDHSKAWDLYTDAMEYAYNTTAHSSTAYDPLELVVNLILFHVAVGEHSHPVADAGLSREKMATNTGRKLMPLCITFPKAQKRYKLDYDRLLLRHRKIFEIVSNALLRIEKRLKTRSDCSHKLSRIADEPFCVITVHNRTIVIENSDNTCDRVRLDIVEPATASSGVIQPTAAKEEHDLQTGPDNSPISDSEAEKPQYFVIKNSSNTRKDPDDPEGQLVYMVKWYGHSKTTW